MTSEVLFLSAMAAGVFGSAHCLGMCGPVVVLFEKGAGGAGRRLVYNGGRLAFYALLGSVAASAGSVLHLVPGGAILLRMLAATMIILLGLQLVFDWQALRAVESAGSWLWRRLSPLTRHVLPANTLPRAFFAGLLWGALPCGLVYTAVALAATSATPLAGATVMVGFWAGTLPALLFAGSAASRLAGWRRQPRARRLAGVALLATGMISLAMPLQHVLQGMSAGGEAAPHSMHH